MKHEFYESKNLRWLITASPPVNNGWMMVEWLEKKWWKNGVKDMRCKIMRWTQLAGLGATGPNFKEFLWKISSSYKSVREGNGTPLQYSCLENPWTEEPGRLQSMGLLRVGHDWATSLSLFTFMHWRRQWQPTPVFLPGESQWESLVGCRLWGRTQPSVLVSNFLVGQS